MVACFNCSQSIPVGVAFCNYCGTNQSARKLEASASHPEAPERKVAAVEDEGVEEMIVMKIMKEMMKDMKEMK
eukprot:6918226-Karenia_brevis.AAC.1